MATANTLNKMPRPAMTAQITIAAPESVRRFPGGFGSAPLEGGAFGPAAGGMVMPLLLALSKPTLLEHLEKLQNAGLVKRMDEGRKWIYYELTDKGRKILHPERVAITLALGAAVVLAAIGAFYLLIAGGVSSAGQTPSTNGPAIMEPAHAGPGILGLVLVLLSLGSVVAAFALRFYGLRRRKRFFEQLSSA